MNNLYEKYKHKLPPKEYKVLHLRKTHTLQAMGALLGLTRERIRQIEAKAIERMAVWEYEATGVRPPGRLQHCSHCGFPKCVNCWDKGYATTIQYATSSRDFPDDPPPHTTQLPIMRFCSCERGKQLKALLDGAKN